MIFNRIRRLLELRRWVVHFSACPEIGWWNGRDCLYVDWLFMCKWIIILFFFCIINCNLYVFLCRRDGLKELATLLAYLVSWFGINIVCGRAIGRCLVLADILLIMRCFRGNWVSWRSRLSKVKPLFFCNRCWLFRLSWLRFICVSILLQIFLLKRLFWFL